MSVNAAILAHYHPDERPFVEKIADLMERVSDRHELRRTDFLDPRQLHIVHSIAGRFPDLHLLSDGGYAGAERQRVVIAPEYIPLSMEDTDLCVIEVTSADDRFAELDHGDYLGALLGLGIKREKIGDIHVGTERAHIVVAEEMAGYIDANLRQVHRLNVFTSQLAIDQLVPVIPTLESLAFTVASMRLDGIVGDVWRLSRAKALIPIKAGRCKVNWKTIEDPSHPLKEGDVVSLKGFGRFVLATVEGETKKGRIRLSVAKYV